MNRDFTKINDAAMFAGLAHASVVNANGSIGQVRKYTQEPYIVHPMAVARLVDEAGEDDDTVIAALLHDVVEDTPVTIETIQETFGDTIARYVADVTDISIRPEHKKKNRVTRKQIDREHLATATPQGQSIKCADCLHNTLDITAHDKDFSRTYLREKRLLLPSLTKANPILLNKAWETLEAGEIKIFGTIQGERS